MNNGWDSESADDRKMCQFEQIYNKQKKMKMAGAERVSGTKMNKGESGEEFGHRENKGQTTAGWRSFRLRVESEWGGGRQKIHSKAYSTATKQASFEAASCPC